VIPSCRNLGDLDHEGPHRTTKPNLIVDGLNQWETEHPQAAFMQQKPS
jgi:hypothetical protein